MHDVKVLKLTHDLSETTLFSRSLLPRRKKKEPLAGNTKVSILLGRLDLDFIGTDISSSEPFTDLQCRPNHHQELSKSCISPPQPPIQKRTTSSCRPLS